MINKIKKIMLPIYLVFYKIYTLYVDKYTYKNDKYKNEFVSKIEKVFDCELEKATEVIYVFWTGNNELTENRKKGLKSIIEKSDVKVELITPENLKEYLLEEYPLHPAYEYLSLIQKSDYLRCYFMLHHGGGYVDIKPCLTSWKNMFEQLNKSDKWCIGVREKFVGSIANIGGSLGADCKKYHNYIISNGGYIFKPNSPIAKEWMAEVHHRLDVYLNDLIKFPGDSYGSGNYPIPWAYLAGYIMCPLVLKYHEKVIRLDRGIYSSDNYR